MQKGTLSLSDGKPHLECIYRCLIDVAAGMDYLHSLGVINGDLKPANILLKSTDADPRGFSCKVHLLSWMYGSLLAGRLLMLVSAHVTKVSAAFACFDIACTSCKC